MATRRSTVKNSPVFNYKISESVNQRAEGNGGCGLEWATDGTDFPDGQVAGGTSGGSLPQKGACQNLDLSLKLTSWPMAALLPALAPWGGIPLGSRSRIGVWCLPPGVARTRGQ